MNITLVQRPPSVSAERIACLVIPLNRDPDLEPSSLEPKIETTGTGIEANDSWRWRRNITEIAARGEDLLPRTCASDTRSSRAHFGACGVSLQESPYLRNVPA